MATSYIYWWVGVLLLCAGGASAQGPASFAADAELRAVMSWVRQRTYDRIPAIDLPQLVTAREASFLQPHDRVIGIVLNGQARAYPLHFLDGREVVNDTLAHTGLAVTW